MHTHTHAHTCILVYTYVRVYLSLSPLRVSGRVAFKMAPVITSEGVDAIESPDTSTEGGQVEQSYSNPMLKQH